MNRLKYKKYHNYTSTIDILLQKVKSTTEFSTEQQAEMDKHKKIHQLRDHKINRFLDDKS